MNFIKGISTWIAEKKKEAADYYDQLHMDYKGQKLAEQIFQYIITLFAIVGFIWGYVCEQFVQTVYVLAAGFLLSCVLTLPPWPMYRMHPLKWQPAPAEEARPSGKDDNSSKSKKGGKKKEK